jgi:hypothetical protein
VTRMVRMIVAALTALALLSFGVPASSTSSEAAARASLKVSPSSNYVAGQKITYTGSIGVRGKHRVKLQYHMNRPGDRWTDVDGFRGATTSSAGKFSFTFPAPSMWGISYRVVSGRHVTPKYTFHAKSQEVLLEAGNDNRVLAGQPFTVVVDTTPSQAGRADLPPPVIPGRTVTLQRRVDGDRWQTIDQAPTDNAGFARFDLTEPTAGTVVYRAREENYTKDGNKIGWFPSFPTYVEVASSVLRGRAGEPDPTPAAPQAQVPLERRAGSPNASQNYGWGPALFDFAWEFGESLTSGPYRGTRRKGGWLDTSSGTGRANHINGGVGLDSQYGARGGPGDVGTTRLTLNGNAQTYGRWEIRMRSLSKEANAPGGDFEVKMELVPDRASDYKCGAQNITIAEYRIHDRAVRVGANALADNRSWTYTKKSVSLENASHNFGVEVAKDHITWFLDGRPIASVKSKAAVSDVPLTLRLSLEGDGSAEMNRTRSIYDWQRAWPIGPGKHVTQGAKLQTGTHDASC